MSAYQPKTGVRCSCKRGVWRDNCPNCEGTGWVIDFAAIRALHERRYLSNPCPVCKAPMLGTHYHEGKDGGR